MRDKLVTLCEAATEEARRYFHESIQNTLEEKHCFNSKQDCKKSIYEIEADYLLANGVVVLPCKVGDTVYDYEARAYKIDNIKFYAQGFPTFTGTRYIGECGVTCTWNFNRIGKTVFLTREEAEAHLERNGGYPNTRKNGRLKREKSDL